MPDRMRKLSDRASQARARFGVRGLLAEAFDKGILRPASLDVVHVLVLEAGAVRPLPVEPDYDLRFLTEEEIVRFSADPTNRIGPEFIERARGGLDLCFGAVREDRLASYAWLALASVEAEHASGAALVLPRNTAYLYKGFTHPDFRGRALYPACMGTALSALRPRGIERLVAFVYWSNAAALQSCEAVGYQRLGRLVVGPRGPIRIPAAARALDIIFGADAEVARVRAESTQRSLE